MQYSTSSSSSSGAVSRYQPYLPDSVLPGTPEISSGIENEPLDLTMHSPDRPCSPSQSPISDIEEYFANSIRMEKMETNETQVSSSRWDESRNSNIQLANELVAVIKSLSIS